VKLRPFKGKKRGKRLYYPRFQNSSLGAGREEAKKKGGKRHLLPYSSNDKETLKKKKEG